MIKRFSLSLLLSLILQACGGSGDSDISPSTPVQEPNEQLSVSPKRVEDGLQLFYPDTFQTNQAASLAVIASNDTIKTVKWQQISGPELQFLAPTSQVISFDISQAANYSFELTVTLTSSAQIQKTIHFSAVQNNTEQATVRLDHVAVEQAKVSLRADKTGTANTADITSITWRQVAGPRVIDFTPEQYYLFFKAPEVSQDTVLEFSATLNFSDGSVATDNSYVLIKNTSINDDGYFPNYADRIVTSEVQPYISDGKYADVLVDCIYNNQLSSTCSFATLPLLGSETLSPTVDDVLSRLVVSHAWMGDRFKQFLQQSSTADDMLKLLRATTAIVIAYDVRPSFYWSATGAIYLDAANFWLTPQERDTLNDQADYRSSFGEALQFMIPWRYVKNNQYYIRNGDYPAASRLTKPFSALEANASWLMYHELGHANDFFPPTSWDQVSANTNPLSYSSNHAASSSRFSQIYPLNSEDLKQLADVSFSGNTATPNQLALEAQDVVALFTPDFAPDYYCYSTIREDFATLFGHFMMAYRLGVSADVAIISTVENEELVVSWGQRDRNNAPQIQQRVKAVVETIFPELDVANIQSTLPAPVTMRSGDDWFSNINLSSNSNASNLQAKPLSPLPLAVEDYWQHYPNSPAIP
ncbi:hypothetical protein [Paraglaciecola sp.]|uniref:hypothetical protein n=1 Tax=Paraglaciecola sp. TaxID=1920173 RepID=UPI00273E539A|nr:hypothetical protein [Paraglaciecola sp.]MDP5029151.1 hypothetical protein [Paraglaciecola sp.]